MPAPQTVIQAAVSRLGARLGSGLLDAAAQAAVVLQDAPERLRQELSLFWDEVEQEAARLERGATTATAAASPSAPPPGAPSAPPPGAPSAPPPGAPSGSSLDPQDQIDALRARVAAFSRRLDERP
ncbi:MAG: hypothetical protein FJ054_09125 [Cyanobacteria bacterium M_surface_10_m2_119]|nr:hypothetical protein [Cyanobacteria bacterium M_surface_10_m2_119]